MKVYWWQSGLHIEPENEKEFEALNLLAVSLNLIQIGEEIVRSPISSTNLCDEKSILSVNIFPKMVS